MIVGRASQLALRELTLRVKPCERAAPRVPEETLRMLLLQLQQVILRFAHQLAEHGIVDFADRFFEGDQLPKQDGAVRQAGPSERNIRESTIHPRQVS